MSSNPTGRPSLLANLILMVLVGGVLFAFFHYLQKKETTKPPAVATDAKPTSPGSAATPAGDDVAGSIAEANRTKLARPVPADEAEAERTRQMLAGQNTRKPFSTPADPAGVTANSPPNVALPVGDDEEDIPTAKLAYPVEPVREVAVGSGEGAALIKDAGERIDEAPADLYNDRAKAKVREGLQTARRIYKVHTVYFLNGGAKMGPKETGPLRIALKEPAITSAMEDPRAVFFVLGFADKTGDPEANKTLSRQRADVVIQELTKSDVLSLTYPVAIGSSELVSPENKAKNRATEVWLVLP